MCICICLLNKFIGEWLYVSFGSHTSGWQTTYVSRSYSHRTWHYAAIQKFIYFDSIQTVSNNILSTLPLYVRICAPVLIWAVAGYVYWTEMFKGEEGKETLCTLSDHFIASPSVRPNKQLTFSQQLHCQLKYCPICIFESFDLPPWPLNLFVKRTSAWRCIALIHRGDDGKIMWSFDR